MPNNKKYIKGFPQATESQTAQEAMTEWKQKYKWDPNATVYGQKGAWYEEIPIDIAGGGEGREDAGKGTDTGGGEGGGGTPVINEESNYRQVLLDALTSYLSSVGSQKSLKEIREEKREELGIPGKEKVVTGLQQQILDVEDLLDKLEGDIKERTIQTGEVVTEAQRRRWEATEGGPLREQLADLMRAETRASTGLTGAREELADLLALEEETRGEEKERTLGLLPLFKEALTYESTEEAFARLLEEEEAKKKAGVERYYKEPSDWREFSAQEKRKLEAAGIDWTTPEGRAKATQYLYGEEEKTFLTSTDYRNLAVKGVPKEVADAIAIALTEGQTLEAIRTGLAAFYGKDTGYGYLDIMIPYLQEKAEEGGEAWGG